MTTFLSENQIRQRLESHTLPDKLDGYVFPRYHGFAPKAASVLILLRPTADQDWEVIFTRRTDKVETHKGQISFPGGARDPEDEDDIQTALREAYEEIGVSVPKENILGRLNTRKTISNYMVSSIIAAAPSDLTYQPNPNEVDRVFTVPLSWLRDPSNRDSSIHPESNQEVFYFSEYDSEVIWGVTAGILVDLIRILENEPSLGSRFDQ